MDIRQLRNFVAVADQKNFTKAAASLKLSQPALSVSIRNLEQELSTTLFVRTRKETLLTDIGATFLAHARAVLREIEKAEEVIATRNLKKQQTVRVGIGSLFAKAVAKQVIARFAKEHPTVKIDLEVFAQPTSITIQRIVSNRWDFSLLLGSDETLSTGQKKELVSEKCLALTTMTHARRNHPLAREPRVSLSDLAQYPWVISTLTEGDGITNLFTRAGVEPPTISSRVNSFDSIVAMIGAENFITILPIELAEKNYGQTVIQLRNDDIRFHSAAVLIYSTEFVMSEPARRLKNEIMTFMSSLGQAPDVGNANPVHHSEPA